MKKSLKNIFLLTIILGTTSCDLINGDSESTKDSSVPSSETFTKHEVNEQEWKEAFSLQNHKNITIDMNVDYVKTIDSISQIAQMNIVCKTNEDKISLTNVADAFYEVDKQKFIEQNYSNSQEVPDNTLLDEAIAEYLDVDVSNIVLTDDKTVKYQLANKQENNMYAIDYSDGYSYDLYRYSSDLNGYVTSRFFGSSLEFSYDQLDIYSNSLYLPQFYNYAVYDDTDKSYTIDGSKLPYQVNSFYSLNFDVLKINESKIQYYFIDNYLSKITLTSLNNGRSKVEINYSDVNETIVDDFPTNIVTCNHRYSDENISLNENFHGKYCYYCGHNEYESHKFIGKYCQICRYERMNYYEEKLTLTNAKEDKVILLKDVDENNILGIKLDFDEQELIEATTSGYKIGYIFYGSDLYVVHESIYDGDQSIFTFYFYSYSTRIEIHEPITYTVKTK